MTLSAREQEDGGELAQLQELLHKREYHLAELVDEIVFAEKERHKAVQEYSAVRELAAHLEDAFNKLLQYHITMHKDVLLPALLQTAFKTTVSSSYEDTNAVSPAALAATSLTAPSNVFLNDLLTEPQLSVGTKELLQTVLQQKEKETEAAHVQKNRVTPVELRTRRAATEADGAAQRATHRAIILSDSLLKNQEVLTRLLRTIQGQAELVLKRWSGDGKLAMSSEVDFPARDDGASTGVAKPQALRVHHHSTSSPTNSFRIEQMFQHSEGARQIESSLRAVEQERDALQLQLLERDHAAAATAAEAVSATATESEKNAWARERVKLKQEIAVAQQRALEEQAHTRALATRLRQLERAPPSPVTVECAQCSARQAEGCEKVSDYAAVKAAWKAEEKRLNKEIAVLQKQHAKDVAELQQHALAASTDTPPANATAAAKERQIGQLEATVAAMSADLQIMELRVSMAKEEREADRQRILAAHAQETARLRDERDSCQTIIDQMTKELHSLSRLDSSMPAIRSPPS